ncbi:NAP1L1, partial [Cordylochernes scorpioides]
MRVSRSDLPQLAGADHILADALTSEVMKNPQVLAAIQSKLGSLVGSHSDYIATMHRLPKPVKRRIKALKKLQLEHTNLEAKFYEEVHALECKYAKLYAPLYERRYQVTSAKIEPTDEECDFPSDDEEKVVDEALAEELKKAQLEEKKENEAEEAKPDENVAGIPEFWCTVLKNVDMLGEMIQEHDEPILKHLQDIRIKFSHQDPMGFTLEFHFEANEHFTNTILTKEYEMKCAPDENDPFSFEGPEIYKCKGCTIDWKKGKNVTVKTIKKKQKHKSRGSVRTVTRTVQNDSFFNFFNPPAVPDDEEQMDEDTQSQLASDFEMGHFIRERIVPRAVLFFTGEALGDDDYEEEEEDDEEEDDEEGEDEDEEEDADYSPPATAKG